MKISRLVIKNIASLKGKHVIDFDQFSSDLNLFAITGPTGSGKSTILNCISLALYGSHYKKSITQTDMVTLGEKEAYVEMCFHFQGIDYMAKWEARVLKNNGEVLKVPKIGRTLFIKKENEFEATEKTTEDILHLSFDQFCKTVILNQGEFSRFLTSSFRERKDILEKLYQGQYLERLGQNLRAQLNMTQASLNENQAQIEALELSGEEDIDSIKEEWAQKHKQKEISQKIEILLRDYQRSLFDLNDQYQKEKITAKRLISFEEELKKEVDHLNAQKAQFHILKENFQKQKDEFDKNRPIYQKCLVWKKQIEDFEKNLQNNEKKIKALYESREKTSHEINEIEERKQTQRIKLEKTKQSYLFLNCSEEKTVQLKSKKKRFSHFQAQKQNLEQSIKIQHNFIEKKQNEYSSLGQRIYQAEQENQLILDKLKEENEKGLRVSLEKLKRESDAFQKSFAQFEIKEQNLKALEEEQKGHEKELELEKTQLTLDLSRHKNLELKLESIELQQKKTQLQLAISTCLDEIKETHQCPVCLSPVHTLPHPPSREENAHLIEENFLQLKEEVIKVKTQIEQREKNIRALGLRAHTNKEKINLLISEFIQLDLGQDSARKILSEFKNKLQQDFLKNQTQLKIKEQALEKIVLLSSQSKQFLEQKTEISNELKQEKERLKESEQLLKNTKQILTDMRLEIFFEIGFCLLSEDIPDFLDEQFDKQIHYQELLSSIENLEVSTLALGQKNKDLYESIRQIKQESAEIKITSEEIHQKLIKQIGNQDPEFLLDQAHQKIDGEAKKVNLFNQKLNSYEVLVKELETKIYQQKEQITQIQTSRHLTIEKIKNAAVQVRSLASEISYLSQELITRVLKPFHEQSFFEDDGTLLELYYQQAQTDLKDLFESISNFFARLIELETTLSRHKKVEKMIKEKLSEKNNFLKRKQELDNLYQLIGKDEFRNFVLSHIEQSLIEQTNIELDSLCDGRYKLVQLKKRSQIPEFYVQDKLKSSSERKISTLSGGETFMVSLAMALALSELTKGQTDIDSFFIDEGFATLDKDSLEDVIEVLNSMRNRGKQIGIISHLEHLTQRLPVNITLRKNGWGHSDIQMIYH